MLPWLSWLDCLSAEHWLSLTASALVGEEPSLYRTDHVALFVCESLWLGDTNLLTEAV